MEPEGTPMTETMQNQLIAEASRQNVKLVDRDVVRCFPDLTDSLDEKDAAGITEAVRKMTEQNPTLFKPEKRWNELSEDDFQKRERAFRESLRKSTPIGPNQFQALDAALLSPEELQS
jgi:hypothetical protein